jgi:hypothetical protein
MFYFELNDNYSVYLQYTYDPLTMTELLEPTSQYTSLIENLSTLHEQDIDKMNGFMDSFGPAVRKKINYLSFSKPKVQSLSIDPKNYLLYAMDGQEVLDIYNWKIYGINSEDPND